MVQPCQCNLQIPAGVVQPLKGNPERSSIGS
uniref:Uncharacterized protein n=1 Tax=Setaria italica TaxID=4555 RepID=K3Y3W0_SETIT